MHIFISLPVSEEGLPHFLLKTNCFYASIEVLLCFAPKYLTFPISSKYPSIDYFLLSLNRGSQSFSPQTNSVIIT